MHQERLGDSLPLALLVREVTGAEAGPLDGLGLEQV